MSTPVLNIDPNNINDALNPHNYVLTPGYIPAVSVTSITSSIFDVTFQSPMAAINYNIKIIDIQTADGLNVASASDTKEFLGIGAVQTTLGTLNVEATATALISFTQTAQRSVFCFEDLGSPTTALLPVEAWLLQNRFKTQGLVQLQNIVMATITSSTLGAVQARTLLKTVFGSDLAATFKDLVTVPASALSVNLCARQRLTLVDQKFKSLMPYYGAALEELRALGATDPYLLLLRTHLTSASFQNRVAANCAIVLLAAAILQASP
jgi:hypothetical protein